VVSSISSTARAVNETQTLTQEIFPGQDKQLTYELKALELIKTLPKDFGALRQLKAAEGGDPLPFAVNTVGKITTVFLPADIPDDTSQERLLSLGIALELANMAGFNVEGSQRQLSADFWNTLDAAKGSLLGAFYCLRRDHIAPMTNVPTEETSGWDFALWYAFSKASKETDYADYMSIPRKTNFLPAKGAAWGASKQFTDLNRLSAFIRLVSQKLSHKVANPKKFLKGEGYFLEKYAGKKPFGGLFTSDEHILMSQDWEHRVSNIKDSYKRIPDNFQDSLMLGGLGQLMQQFNKKSTALIKTIENAAQARIPMLLVSTGSGRTRKQAIAKGGNLPEKLLSINGGDSVRTIGKVLWSPTLGVPQTEFVEVSLKLARTKLTKSSELDNLEKKIVDDLTKVFQDDVKVKTAVSSLFNASTVYLEVFPDHESNPAWVAAIAPK
jgi:hypothetical protein